LQHPLLYRRQGCKVGVIQFRQKAALYMISNFVLADRVQSMAGMSISVGVETRKTGKNYLKRKV